MSSNKLQVTTKTQHAETNDKKQLVHFLIKYGDIEKAARAVKISPSEAKKLLAHPTYLKMFQAEYRTVLLTQIAPMAVAIIRDTMSGRLKPDKIKADLAKTILDRIGLGATKPEEADRIKDTEGMSIAELESHISKLKFEASNVATVIDAHVDAHENPQPLDFID